MVPSPLCIPHSPWSMSDAMSSQAWLTCANFLPLQCFIAFCLDPGKIYQHFNITLNSPTIKAVSPFQCKGERNLFLLYLMTWIHVVLEMKNSYFRNTNLNSVKIFIWKILQVLFWFHIKQWLFPAECFLWEWKLWEPEIRYSI